MKRPQHRIVLIIELFGHEYSLVASKRHWFGETGLVNIVNWSPRTIHPMGSCFQYIMLEIMLMEEENALFIGLFRKFTKTLPVPLIGLCQVIFGKSVPCCALSATGKRLFIERCPYITVGTTNTLMIRPPKIVPQSIVMIEHSIMVLLQITNH